MWEFSGIIIDQLGDTFRWFLTGFFLTIVILILLYKNNLLANKGSFSFIKKISYYLFFPLYIGIISWFHSATLIVEKEAKELAKITIEQAENSLFPQFSKYILSLADDWMGGKVNSKEELVESYLKKNNYEKGSFNTKAMEWTLLNGIEYIENKAIENDNLQIGDEKMNFPKLISDYLNGADGIANMPFSYLQGISLKSIHNYARSFYSIYYIMGFIVVLILGLDIYYYLKRRNKEERNFINPITALENNQKKLENNQKR